MPIITPTQPLPPLATSMMADYLAGDVNGEIVDSSTHWSLPTLTSSWAEASPSDTVFKPRLSSTLTTSTSRPVAVYTVTMSSTFADGPSSTMAQFTDVKGAAKTSPLPTAITNNSTQPVEVHRGLPTGVRNFSIATGSIAVAIALALAIFVIWRLTQGKKLKAVIGIRHRPPMSEVPERKSFMTARSPVEVTPVEKGPIGGILKTQKFSITRMTGDGLFRSLSTRYGSRRRNDKADAQTGEYSCVNGDNASPVECTEPVPDLPTLKDYQAIISKRSDVRRTNAVRTSQGRPPSARYSPTDEQSPLALMIHSPVVEPLHIRKSSSGTSNFQNSALPEQENSPHSPYSLALPEYLGSNGGNRRPLTVVNPSPPSNRGSRIISTSADNHSGRVSPAEQTSRSASNRSGRVSALSVEKDPFCDPPEHIQSYQPIEGAETGNDGPSSIRAFRDLQPLQTNQTRTLHRSSSSASSIYSTPGPYYDTHDLSIAERNPSFRTYEDV